MLHVAHALVQRAGIASIVVLCVGYSDFPLDATPQADLDAKLLGTWRCLPPDARPDVEPWSLAISQAHERVYGVRVETKNQAPRLLEAYASLVNGQPILNVNLHELEQQAQCSAPWGFARYALLSPDVLRIRYVKEDVFRGVERTPAAFRRALERVADDPASYQEAALCLRTAPQAGAPASASPTPAPSPQAPVEPKQTVARFVGSITGLSLPREPVKVIPIGVDPKFVLSIKIVKMVEGALPSKADSVAFLIHSPSRFFAENLPSVSVREGSYPEGEFVFSLVGKRGEAGAAEFELRMSALGDDERASKAAPATKGRGH